MALADRARIIRQMIWLTAANLMILALGATIIYQVNTRSIARERSAREASEQAFCGIIVLLDDSWRSTPPTAPSGKALAAAVAEARAVNHCPSRS